MSLYNSAPCFVASIDSVNFACHSDLIALSRFGGTVIASERILRLHEDYGVC
jgi:hypothetical protein